MVYGFSWTSPIRNDRPQFLTRVETINIWLIYPYGGIPGEGLRPDRPGMLAEALAAAGHRVTWWVSGFSHRAKRHRVAKPTTIKVSDRFTIRIVPTSSYHKNISFARIRSEAGYAAGMLRWAEGEPLPDVVMISEPSLFYGRAALQTVKKSGASLVLDTLDLWPEMFHIALPRCLRQYGRQIFAPLYARRARLFAQANGILAASREYASLSKRMAPHLPDDLVRTVYFGVNVKAFRETMRGPGALPEGFPAPRESNEVRLVFASTLGSNYDIETVLAAAERLTNDGVRYRLYIAGTGPLQSMVAERAGRGALKRACFLGNPDADTMARIYSHCDIGISAYVPGSHVAMPIKAFHYCAAGLAVVNSLGGEFEHLLSTSGAGVQYRSGDPTSLSSAIARYSTNPALLAAARSASFDLGKLFDTAAQYPSAVALVERVAALGSAPIAGS